VRPVPQPTASSQFKSLRWRRRAWSRSCRTSTLHNALGAGTRAEPGEGAGLTRCAQRPRAHKGRQRPKPATRVRRRRPGARRNARASATTVVSGQAGAGGGGCRGGRPRGGCTKRGDRASGPWCAPPADPGAQRGRRIAARLGDGWQATPCDAAGPPRFGRAVRGRPRGQQATAAARVLPAPALRQGARVSPG
jgi:hypothetical protein